MAKPDYIAPNDRAFNSQLQKFKDTIGDYATVLGLTPAQLAVQAADATAFNHTLKCMSIATQASRQWTAWKDLERDGGVPPDSGAPVPPEYPPAVPPVAPGIEARFRALVRIVKASPEYNESMGLALGIEGARPVGPDLATVQPQIAVAISGGHVHVKWGWGGQAAWLDLCEIQVDRGDGRGFNLLAYDTTPGYTDPENFPTPPAKWTYRAIYHVDDAAVGRWSLPVSITVGG